MSDFPILKWVNVDGRSVPFTYPQHKKDGGYVETGDENPLPVGNHVMSEGGLWIPEPEVRSTQLTGSVVEEIYYNLSFTELLNVADADVQKEAGYNIDVSKHRNRFVNITNNHNASIEASLQLKVNSSIHAFTLAPVLTKSIPAYGILTVSEEEFPIINAPAPYLRLRLKREESVEGLVGHVRIVIFGGAY